MENKTKALLIGASGLTGSHCLNLLLEDNYFQEVEIWCRKPTGVKHKKLTETIINFEKLSDININAQLVFCCLGTTIKKAGTKENFFKTDHDYVIDLAKNTRQKAAEKFIYISSIGANAKSSNFYLKTKGQVEKDLKTVFTEGLFILRPSMLMGKRK
ncbi:MAG: NAD(P)H-binding protein, partial [Bacteroidales bacterium]